MSTLPTVHSHVLAALHTGPLSAVGVVDAIRARTDGAPAAGDVIASLNRLEQIGTVRAVWHGSTRRRKVYAIARDGRVPAFVTRRLVASSLFAAVSAGQVARGNERIAPRHATLPLQIVDRAHLLDDTQASVAGREVQRIWAQFGVDVEWNCGAPGIVVDVEPTPSPQQPTTSNPIVASLTFQDGVPERRLRVWHPTARSLAAAGSFAGLPIPNLAPALRAELTGRLIGRAISHEIGHFILGTTTHTRGGLMRAAIGTDLFLRADIAAFRLTHDERQRVDLWEARFVSPAASTCDH